MLKTLFTAAVLTFCAVSGLGAQESVTVAHRGDEYQITVREAGRIIMTGPVPGARAVLAEYATPAGSPALYDILARWQAFPRPMIDSIMSGLEEIAISSANPDVRARAISTLAVAGSGDGVSALRIPGSAARLIRIYESADCERRLHVISGLGTAAEHPSAVAFLRRVAVLPASDENRQLAEEAVRALALLGPEGPAALRELHRRDAVKNPSAKGLLRALARMEYRIPRH